MIKQQLKALILMLQFMTRLPIPGGGEATPEDFRRGIPYMPVVGAVLGGILYGTQWLLLAGLPMLLQAPALTGGVPIEIALFLSALLVTLDIMLTGGLHLDGVADTFDGLYSYRDPGRILEIMKDSRIGTNGAIALVSVILLRLLSLTVLLRHEISLALLCMPIIARYSVLLLCYKAPSARPGGMGDLFIGKITPSNCIAGFLLLIGILLLEPALLLPVLLTLLFAALYRRHVIRILTGLTGDIIGATVELSGTVFLLSAALLTLYRF